jgi:hypothetical protein
MVDLLGVRLATGAALLGGALDRRLLALSLGAAVILVAG